MYETISECFREKLCKKKRESGRDGEIESVEQRQSQKIVGWYSPKLLSNFLISFSVLDVYTKI